MNEKTYICFLPLEICSELFEAFICFLNVPGRRKNKAKTFIFLDRKLLVTFLDNNDEQIRNMITLVLI